jgi:CheY-like chemotaxis protein
MRPLKILLAEDDADERELYGYMLAAAGYKVKAVSNGLEALVEVQVNRPDVIVTSNSQYGELIRSEDDRGRPDGDGGPPWI